MAEPELPTYAAALRRADPDRFFTALFAPPARRDTLFLLYALNHELARAREVTSEPMLALIRLQWWREVIAGEPKRHDLATPLHAAVADGRLSAADLFSLVDAREAEADPAFPTRDSLFDYLDRTAGALAAAAGRALGADAATRDRISDLGTAYGVSGQIRAIAALARQGRCLLPEDILAAHGLTTHDVIADPNSPRLLPVVKQLAGEGMRRYLAGRGAFAREIIAAALPGVFARADLRRPGGPAHGRGFLDKARVMAAAGLGRI